MKSLKSVKWQMKCPDVCVLHMLRPTSSGWGVTAFCSEGRQSRPTVVMMGWKDSKKETAARGKQRANRPRRSIYPSIDFYRFLSPALWWVRRVQREKARLSSASQDRSPAHNCQCESLLHWRQKATHSICRSLIKDLTKNMGSDILLQVSLLQVVIKSYKHERRLYECLN